MPLLIIHGDADKTVPIEASGNRISRQCSLLPIFSLRRRPTWIVLYPQGQLNRDLIQFIGGVLPLEQTKAAAEAGII